MLSMQDSNLLKTSSLKNPVGKNVEKERKLIMSTNILSYEHDVLWELNEQIGFDGDNYMHFKVIP
jgi:hypothetical protein